MKVNPYAPSNISSYDTAYSTKKMDAINSSGVSHTQAEQYASVKVDISEEAKNLSLELKEIGDDSILKFDAAAFSKEARAKSKEDFMRSALETKAIDPFDNEFQILGVKGIYSDGTLEKFISDKLEGKVKNASLVANELGQMIRGNAYNTAETVEERAVNRETALKNAEYIAKTYFDNPNEAKAFLDEINRFAENDILREKGYIVFDNSDISPFKSYESSIRSSGEISWNAYAKQAGYTNTHEIISDKQKLSSFYEAIKKNQQKWSEEIIKSFNDNEKNVADIISNVKNTLSDSDVAKSLQRLMKAF